MKFPLNLKCDGKAVSETGPWWPKPIFFFFFWPKPISCLMMSWDKSCWPNLLKQECAVTDSNKYSHIHNQTYHIYQRQFVTWTFHQRHWKITLQWRHNGAMVSQITSLMIVYSTVYSGADQRKHQSSASLAFVRGIHRRPVNSPHKEPVTRKMFPFDDVIMQLGALSLQICVPILNLSYHNYTIHTRSNPDSNRQKLKSKYNVL